MQRLAVLSNLLVIVIVVCSIVYNSYRLDEITGAATRIDATLGLIAKMQSGTAALNDFSSLKPDQQLVVIGRIMVEELDRPYISCVGKRRSACNDCSRFAQRLHARFKVYIPDYSLLQCDPANGGKRVLNGAFETFDIVCVDADHNGKVDHVETYLFMNHTIGSRPSTGVTITSLREGWLASSIMYGMRY